MIVRVLPDAEVDLRNLRDFWSERGVRDKFLSAFQKAIEWIEFMPHAAPKVGRRFRLRALRKFKVGILYRPGRRTITVFAVVDLRSDRPELRDFQ